MFFFVFGKKSFFFSAFFCFFFVFGKKSFFCLFFFFSSCMEKNVFFSSCLEKNHFFGHFLGFFFSCMGKICFLFFLCVWKKIIFFGFSLCCDGKIVSTSFNIEKNSNFCGLKRIPNFYFNEFGKEFHLY